LFSFILIYYGVTKVPLVDHLIAVSEPIVVVVCVPVIVDAV
jgi:hypothetical protein